MIGVEGGREASSMTRTRSRWKKFRELISLQIMRNLLLYMNGRLYTSCMGSLMLYGGEIKAVNDTWR